MKLKEYSTYPTYSENDLGLLYTSERTVLKVWAPSASKVLLRLYTSWDAVNPKEVVEMSNGVANSSINGIWRINLTGDFKGYFYTIQIVTIDGKELLETPDMYATAVSVNGKRGAIIDMKETNPNGWDNDVTPVLAHKNEAIIYELHLRDLSVSKSSGIKNKGKYLGLTETNTVNSYNQSTGLDHIKELGVTHVHLQPTFDFYSIDETTLEKNNFNWGYDPQNYNAVEGSYASDPFDPITRIKEYKQMVQTLHKNGIGVIMDMVYNHTGKTEESVLNQTVPGYFYRQKADKTYSNASGCGNETASERYMMRKFMIESLVYWAKEYHIDGFRIDLMGIHDIITMNEISDALRTINPNILIYGEGWTAGESPLPDSLRALKNNTYKLKNISVFSDELRDGVKGHWSDHKAKGFISGQTGLEESIKFGIAGGIHHHQVHYNQVNNSKKAWALEPYQCINYVSCHDDNTLWDKILISAPEVDESSRIKMDLLANTIVFTSQGIPFMLAGEEFLRTKQLVSNSYKSPDNINQIDWDRKKTYQHVFEYYKKLIQMRKNHPSLRMTDSETIKKNLHFLSFTKQNIIGYTIKHGKTSGDTWDEILVIFNGNKEIEHIPIPGGKWKVIVENTHFLEEEKIIENNIKVEGTSAFIIVK